MSSRALRYFILMAALTVPFAIDSASASSLKTGSRCTKSGQVIHMNAKVYTCIKLGKKLVWSKGAPEKKMPPRTDVQNNGNNSSSQTSDQSGITSGSSAQQQNMPADKEFLYMKRIGMNCSTNGIYGFTGGGLAICKNKIVKYALPSDIPAAPADGYKTRPSWYPTLAQQLGKLTEPTCSPSSIKFTSPVVPIDSMAPSVPYGAMIGGHVTPIDHAYLGINTLYKDAATRTESDYLPVTAPADGVITSAGNLGSPTSIRIVIEHGCNVVTVYMVLNKLSGVLASYAKDLAVNGMNMNLNIPIKAGQEFARQRDNMIDFNVWDGTQWLSGFANPYAYTSGDAWKPYTADPLPFFTPELRAAIEAKMQRTTSPRFGKIDYDVNGTASGNWFLEGTLGYSGHALIDVANATSDIPGGQTQGKNDYSWSHLAIAPHEVDTNRWIFSTGWWKDPAGDARQFLLNVGSTDPTPDKLTPASGVVVYQLTQYSPVEPVGSPVRISGSTAPFGVGYTLNNGMTQGVVALQVNNDGSLNVEINTSYSSADQFSAFSSAKRTYRR